VCDWDAFLCVREGSAETPLGSELDAGEPDGPARDAGKEANGVVNVGGADGGPGVKPQPNTNLDGGAKDDAGKPTPEVDAGQAKPPAPPPECVDDSDCSVTSSCAHASCSAGHCVSLPVSDGTALASAEQVPGDCQQIVCDGKSGETTRADATDLPKSSGNACEQSGCKDGKIDHAPVPDGQACNGSGQCRAGNCSVCVAGGDCTQPTDCTQHTLQCVDGAAKCVDTGKSMDGKACAAGKVCSASACVSCVVGAVCGTAAACKKSSITSCDRGPLCDVHPISGGSCGADVAGNTKTCRAGACVYECKTGACATPNKCVSGQWQCGDGSQAPVCVAKSTPEADGTTCDADSSCHAGNCMRAALVNGDLSQGFRGWTLTGDAQRFITGADANFFGRRFVTTWVGDPNGDAGKGTISQTFTVPSDAIALRFLVTGGHAHVRLRAAGGNILEDVTGPDSNDVRVPVSWDLSMRRGQMLSLSLEDDLDAQGWSFVSVVGFDVIRDVQTGLRNPQFEMGLTSWATTGDAAYFNKFSDWNNAATTQDGQPPLPAYGSRSSVSTFVFDMASPNVNDAATGTLLQQFIVPSDAVALRFNLHGGKSGHVYLRSNSVTVYTASAGDANFPKVPISWDLVPHRGTPVQLVIEDNTSTGAWAFIGVSGFDLITTYNGP
jgi:hypothetical protein